MKAAAVAAIVSRATDERTPEAVAALCCEWPAEDGLVAVALMFVGSGCQKATSSSQFDGLRCNPHSLARHPSLPSTVPHGGRDFEGGRLVLSRSVAAPVARLIGRRSSQDLATRLLTGGDVRPDVRASVAELRVNLCRALLAANLAATSGDRGQIRSALGRISASIGAAQPGIGRKVVRGLVAMEI